MNPIETWEAAKAAHPDYAGSIDARRASAGVDAAWARWQAPGNVWTATRYSGAWLLAFVRDTPKQRHVTIWQRRKLYDDTRALVPVGLTFRTVLPWYSGQGTARGWDLASNTVRGTAADAVAALARALGAPVLQWPQSYDPRTGALDSARREVEDAELEERRARAVHEAAARRLDLARARLSDLESEGGDQ